MDNYVVDEKTLEIIRGKAVHEHKTFEEVFLRTIASENKDISALDFLKIMEVNKINSDNWYIIVVRLYYTNDNFNEICLNIYNLDIDSNDYCYSFYQEVVKIVDGYMKLMEENLDEIEYNENPVFEQFFSEDKCLNDSLSNYINYLSNFQLLTAQQERALFKRYNEGDLNAKKLIIESNQRLVLSRALKWFNNNNINNNIDLMDLIQEGNFGLFEAINKYDYRYKFKFSTYAVTWIEQKIRRFIDEKNGIIRIPANTYNKVKNIKSAISDYQEKYGNIPTDLDLANFLKCNISYIKEYRYCEKTIIPLDTPVGDDEDMLLSNVIADPNAISPEESYIAKELHDIFDDFFKNYTLDYDSQDVTDCAKSTTQLTSKEVDIIKKRYGLYDGTARTLDDIGREYNVTRERIRQIEARALRKIKSYNSLKKKLEGYK